MRRAETTNWRGALPACVSKEAAPSAVDVRTAAAAPSKDTGEAGATVEALDSVSGVPDAVASFAVGAEDAATAAVVVTRSRPTTKRCV